MASDAETEPAREDQDPQAEPEANADEPKVVPATDVESKPEHHIEPKEEEEEEEPAADDGTDKATDENTIDDVVEDALVGDQQNEDDEGEGEDDVEEDAEEDGDEQRKGRAEQAPFRYPGRDHTLLTFNGVSLPAYQLDPYKSYRKKYRKMRLEFEYAMRRANAVFVEEHVRWDVAKRLKEENDQILEIITDLVLENRSRLPENSEDAKDIIDRRLKLSQLEQDMIHTPHGLSSGDLIPSDLLDLDNIDESAIDLKKDSGLPILVNHSYSTYDPTYKTPPAYLTPEQEETYLAELDASLSAMPSIENLPSGVETVIPRPPPFKRVKVTEEDFSMRNPISVHNWLRRHQPHIFEEVKEKGKSSKEERDREEDAPPTRARGGGTASTTTRKYTRKDKTLAKQDQPFEVLDDEIGFDPTYDPPTLGSSRGKKRKDDDTYRPKGGHSRGGKRKREDGEGSGRGRWGKRARTSTATAGDDAA